MPKFPRVITDPADLAFETAPERPSLAPRMVRDLDARHRPPDPARQRRGKRNRRSGNAAQREWAKLVGGRNVGVLGDADVEGADGMYWEIKALSRPTIGAIEAALDQVAVHAVRGNRAYGVALRLANRPAERRWLVVLRGPEWLDLHGGG